jgi:hypothetical protein
MVLGAGNDHLIPAGGHQRTVGPGRPARRVRVDFRVEHTEDPPYRKDWYLKT